MPRFLGLDPVHWMLIAGGVYLVGLVVHAWIKRGRDGW